MEPNEATKEVENYMMTESYNIPIFRRWSNKRELAERILRAVGATRRKASRQRILDTRRTKYFKKETVTNYFTGCFCLK